MLRLAGEWEEEEEEEGMSRWFVGYGARLHTSSMLGWPLRTAMLFYHSMAA